MRDITRCAEHADSQWGDTPLSPKDKLRHRAPIVRMALLPRELLFFHKLHCPLEFFDAFFELAFAFAAAQHAILDLVNSVEWTRTIVGQHVDLASGRLW